jgi:hypothetical protein
MNIYQSEVGQIGLTFGITLDQKDLGQILGHDPINIRLDSLQINISFCEPPKPVSFDTDRGVYFISLCHNEMNFLRRGNSLIAVHMIDGVQFTLVIFLEKTLRNLRDKLNKKIALFQYMLLRGSTLEQ